MNLNVGDIFTRDQLSICVGAGGDSCFLHKQKTVVAITMNPELNPDAPEILLVGKGPMKERYAAALLASGDVVPTFIKRDVNQWEYMGEFKAEKIEHDKDLISEHSKISRRNDIWGVMFLGSQG